MKGMNHSHTYFGVKSVVWFNFHPLLWTPHTYHASESKQLTTLILLFKDDSSEIKWYKSLKEIRATLGGTHQTGGRSPEKCGSHITLTQAKPTKCHAVFNLNHFPSSLSSRLESEQPSTALISSSLSVRYNHRFLLLVLLLSLNLSTYCLWNLPFSTATSSFFPPTGNDISINLIQLDPITSEFRSMNRLIYQSFVLGS